MTDPTIDATQTRHGDSRQGESRDDATQHDATAYNEARYDVALTVNAAHRSARVTVRRTLSDFLRHDLGLTGTHVGCEHGVCGACTIQIDGSPARACVTLAVQIDGANLRTIEDLAPEPGRLSVLQEAFRRHHALQCGFCTAGILMSLDWYLRQVPDPNEEALREFLSGHICRCTGYVPIIAAALDAAKRLREAGESK
jgi:2-furoyl-CoA dehydrogenase 2Fe-2S iron sulfur subunit